ncbi:MAG: hypothetical protein VX609_05665 [Verrucomicrobiota bacterium]|nr:hypothetical protein [Verrucomicrobiota bacterium]
MDIFLKIGLPWALSLGVVFYIGLELGSYDKDPTSLPNPVVNNSPKALANLTVKEKSSRVLISTKQGTSPNLATRQRPDKRISPPLPPNLRRIMEDGSMVERMGAYMDALRGMDLNTIGEVVDAFESLPQGYGRHLEMKLLMRSWADLDPLSALNYAQNSLDAKSEKRFAISEVLAGWAVRDADAAISWVTQYQQQNSDSKESQNLMIGVVKGLAENDLTSADDFFRTLPQNNAKWQASTFLAQEYAKLGIDEAIMWADRFPKDDERMRTMILGQLSSKLAQQDLDGTAKWAESIPLGEASEQVVSNLLSKWTSKDPQEAANWTIQIQDSKKRVQAMKLLTNKWALRDPVATAGWLNNFPPSAELDPVVSEFVNRISIRDPEGAVGWASSIVDQQQKEKALEKALRAWDRKDPDQANAWRTQNNFSRSVVETEN